MQSGTPILLHPLAHRDLVEGRRPGNGMLVLIFVVTGGITLVTLGMTGFLGERALFYYRVEHAGVFVNAKVESSGLETQTHSQSHGSKTQDEIYYKLCYEDEQGKPHWLVAFPGNDQQGWTAQRLGYLRDQPDRAVLALDLAKDPWWGLALGCLGIFLIALFLLNLVWNAWKEWKLFRHGVLVPGVLTQITVVGDVGPQEYQQLSGQVRYSPPHFNAETISFSMLTRGLERKPEAGDAVWVLYAQREEYKVL